MSPYSQGTLRTSSRRRLPFWRGETMMLAGPERLGRVCGLGWTTPVFDVVVAADARSGLVVVLGPVEDWPFRDGSWFGAASMVAVLLSCFHVVLLQQLVASWVSRGVMWRLGHARKQPMDRFGLP